MAQKVQIILSCDKPVHTGKEDPEAGVETINFGLDGKEYEIEVCTTHGPPLRDFLASYVEHARLSGRARSAPGRTVRNPVDKGRLTEIRVWAKGQGLKVNDRGRIAGPIVAQFDAAHGR